MRLAAPLILFAVVTLPLASRAEDKPPLKLACSVTILLKGELSECMDVTSPSDDDALKSAHEGCDAMATNINSADFQKENPGSEARTSSIDGCNTSEYLTACVYSKGAKRITLTTRTYTIDRAFWDKNRCTKEKGKWIENPAYQDYLHPPKVSAEQIHQEWRTNQAKAMQERGKKPMALFGKLYQVKVDDDQVSVILNVTGFQRLVLVTGISSEKAATFKPNAVINFERCVLTGRTQMWDNPVVACE